MRIPKHRSPVFEIFCFSMAFLAIGLWVALAKQSLDTQLLGAGLSLVLLQVFSMRWLARHVKGGKRQQAWHFRCIGMGNVIISLAVFAYIICRESDEVGKCGYVYTKLMFDLARYQISIFGGVLGSSAIFHAVRLENEALNSEPGS
jgi:hypothetical protein